MIFFIAACIKFPVVWKAVAAAQSSAWSTPVETVVGVGEITSGVEALGPPAPVVPDDGFGIGIKPGELGGGGVVDIDPVSSEWVFFTWEVPAGTSVMIELSNGGCATVFGPTTLKGKTMELPNGNWKFEYFDGDDTNKGAAGGSDTFLFSIPSSGVLPAEITARRINTGAHLIDISLNDAGEMLAIFNGPGSAAYIFDNEPTPNIITSIAKDTVDLQSGVFFNDVVNTFGSSNATQTAYTFQFQNVPEFSMTTMLLATLLSGFVVMFVIRRRKD